jgi:hypothetical protein
MSKIYRFISFETFVDTILRQQLTFVHPSLWDDPYEFDLFNSNFRNALIASEGGLDVGSTGAVLEHIVSWNTYCQSWTRLPESDALWRIYGFNNTSIRITVDTDNLAYLDDVILLDCEYIDDYEDVTKRIVNFYEVIKTKRRAFEHEKEVRLIHHKKFRDIEEANVCVSDFIRLTTGEPKFFQHIELEDISDEVDKMISRLNYEAKNKVKPVDFSRVSNFIEGVLINPFAPDWFCGTVQLLCERQGIKFDGKSKLYSK